MMSDTLRPPSYKYLSLHSSNISPETQAIIDKMQLPSYLDRFEAKDEISGKDFIDALGKFMEDNQIPPGMLNILNEKVQEYDYWFVIDDSGSMNLSSGLEKSTACKEMDGQWHPRNINQTWMSRWEEVQNRLHLMAELLSCLPGKKITFSFMNRNDRITLENKENTPEECKKKLHDKINEIFIKEPEGQTPTYKTLEKALDSCKDHPTHICVFTDGVPASLDIPDQAEHIQCVKDLVIARSNPEQFPVTFMSCTNNDDDVEWLKGLDGDAQFCAELDDYLSELKEILEKQGKGFKLFSHGFYIMCCLAAALDKTRLDALDETKPFTRKTMNELRGVPYTVKEYLKYFKKHPEYNRYKKYKSQFTRDDIEAKDINESKCFGLFSRRENALRIKKQQQVIMEARARLARHRKSVASRHALRA